METLIATAAFGLEAVVSRELRALGYEPRATRAGRLSFRGDWTAMARANLWLRASDRVLLELGGFDAGDFDALFEGTRALAWERLLPPDASFPVRGRSVRSQLSSVPACQSIVKKAIVERLRAAHRVQTLPESGATYPVDISILKDHVSLCLDTSGAGLHKRGYRSLAGEAPLKETLAAGLVLLSFWTRERPFLDPFCGTGTIPIEAALLARNRAPGSSRTFAAESWSVLPEKVWRDARQEARELERRETEPGARIRASDIDPKVLALARASAAKAGVAEDIGFARRAFADITDERTYGCLVTNPPYGDRLSDRRAVGELYRSMPYVLRRFPTWSHYILTSWQELESVLGQSADRRRKLYNGPLRCTFYQFHGPRPGSRARAPSFGGIGDKGARQVEIFSNRLRKRAHHLRKWPRKRGIDCYRLYESDIKEVPLVLDRYGELYFVRPARAKLTSRTEAEQADWLDAMVRAASTTLGVPLERFVVSGRPGRPRRTTVHEEDLELGVVLTGDREPALVPDGRLLRRRLRELAPGQRCLVAGAHAEGYARAAAAGGARIVSAGPYELAVIDSPEDEDAIARTFSCLTPGGISFVVTRKRHVVPGAEDITDTMLPEDCRSRRRFRCFRLVAGPQND